MNLDVRKKILLPIGVILLALLLYLTFRPLSYHPPVFQPMKPETTFEPYLQEKLRLSRERGVRPGNEERLVRFADRTSLAILYIHGYGASRAEGELVVDRLAEALKANTYYMRLPGHGTNPDDQASARYTDYLDAVEEAYQHTRLLGDHVLIVGTSMGGLLATYLGSRHPEIAGLMLASPFFDFDQWAAHLANEPGGMAIIEMINGSPYRKTERNPSDPNDRRIEGYQDFWYAKQYMKSLRSLEDLREYAARRGTYERVEMPVLMLYYYRDEVRQDKSASVPAMLEAFHSFGALTHPNPLNRAVAIEDGSHVLLSRWVEADHERCYQEMLRFIEDVLAARPARASADLDRENASRS